MPWFPVVYQDLGLGAGCWPHEAAAGDDAAQDEGGVGEEGETRGTLQRYDKKLSYTWL